MAEELVERPSAPDEIARLWHTSAFDLEGRRQLLTKALAAGRPLGMRSWAGNCEQDTGYSDPDGPDIDTPREQPTRSADRSACLPIDCQQRGGESINRRD
jgi:hypothetical protein